MCRTIFFTKKLRRGKSSSSMSTCSYRWEEWDEEKGKIVEKRCQKEIWEGSDEFCIFHDPSPEKDVDLFKEKLEEQMESETEEHSFIGYYFSENWDFSGKEFKIDVDFRGATFQGTNFWGASFQGTASFWGASFQNAYFEEATFQDANFRGATFQDANFRGATFHKKVELILKNNEKMDLRYTEFLSKNYITANLSKTLFHRASIENVTFVDCVWPDNYEIYEEKNMKDENINLTFNELETIYRNLKQNMRNHGDYSKAGELYYREIEMKRKGASKIKERIGLTVYKYLAGYGERYWNTAAVSGCVIFFFAFLYGITDCLQYSVQNPCLYQEIIDVVYFSFVTFTTLGLGDITPLTTLGKVLICLEAVIGAFMIAVFVVVFVRKMAR